MASSFKVRYRPANTRADLRRDAPASTNMSMQEFLLSDRVQKVAMEAAKDIQAAAQQIAGAVATKTGAYASSFDHHEGPSVVIDGNPRRTARVANDDAAAAPLEFGNSRQESHRIMGRAGQPWNTEKRTS